MAKDNKYQKYFDDFDRCLDRMLRSDIFLPLGLELMKRKIIFTDQLPSGGIACTDMKYIFVNPNAPFFYKSSVFAFNRFMFVLLHEVLHIILGHEKRKGHRNHKMWNFATDFMINFFLYQLENDKSNTNHQNQNLIQFDISGYESEICFSKDFENLLEEEIYELLMKESKISEKKSSINYKKFLDSVGADSKDADPNDEIQITETKIEFRGKTYKDVDIQFPNQKGSIESRPEEGSITEEDLSRAMFEQRLFSRGFESSSFSKFLKRMFQVKVDWATILRDSLLVELQKSPDMSYNRPRMSWLANADYLPYLPNQDDAEQYGTVVITIDESGSITDDDISKAVDIIKQSDSYYKKIYVVKHDTEPTWRKEYEKISDADIEELMERKHCGGTSHATTFQHIVDYSKANDTYISLILVITDMFSDLDESQKIISGIPRIYLTPIENPQQTEGITGKVIKIK